MNEEEKKQNIVSFDEILENDKKEKDNENKKENNEKYYSDCCMAFYNKAIFSIIKFIYKLMKIFFQIIEFYLIIILTNIFVEYILIFISTSYNTGVIMKCISFIFCSIFTYLSTFPLTLYYYEFSNLSWLKNQNFFQIMGYEREKKEKKIKFFIFLIFGNFILIIATILYIQNNTFDKAKQNTLNHILLVLLICIPILKVLSIYIFAVINFIKQPSKDTNNAFYIAQKSKWKKKKIILKLLLGLISLLYDIIISFDKGITINNFLMIIGIYVFIMPIFISIDIQPWLFHSISKKCFCWENDYRKIKDENTIYHKINQKSKAIKNWNNLSLIFYILMILIFLFNFIQYIFLSSNSDQINTIQKVYNSTKNFSGIPWKEEKNSSRDYILNTMCYTKIHHLNIVQLTGLASAAYLIDEKNSEENIINAFSQSIFHKTENNLKIENMTFLTEETDYAIILQTDIEIPTEKPLTIISIRGTVTILDIWLDTEMFITSALFSIARKVPLLYKLESIISSFYTFFSTITIRNLDNLTLTKQYVDKIIEIINRIKLEKGYSTSERNYIIAGHSLGGGLAKYISFIEEMQGFSVSGPGVSPLEYSMKKKEEKYSKYYKSSYIDIVPDLDIVPRVELSAGTQFRVLCEKGVLQCHSIDRTLCMIGVMCYDEHLTGDLCSGIYNYDQYLKDFKNVFDR